MQDVKVFIQDWVSEHVRASGFPDEADKCEAQRLADMCADAGFKHGISRDDLDAAAADMIGGGDDLADLMFNSLEEAVEDEIRERVGKDD